MNIHRRDFKASRAVFLQMILNKRRVSRSCPPLVEYEVAQAVENNGAVVHFDRF